MAGVFLSRKAKNNRPAHQFPGLIYGLRAFVFIGKCPPNVSAEVNRELNTPQRVSRILFVYTRYGMNISVSQ